MIDRLRLKKSDWSFQKSHKCSQSTPSSSSPGAHRKAGDRMVTVIGSWLRNTELQDRLLFTFREGCSSGCSLRTPLKRGLKGAESWGSWPSQWERASTHMVDHLSQQGQEQVLEALPRGLFHGTRPRPRACCWAGGCEIVELKGQNCPLALRHCRRW